MVPRGGQDGQKTEKEHRPKKIEVSTCRRRPFLKEKVANMAPSCRPKSTKIDKQIDAKIYQKTNAFQDRFSKRFWWILEWKWKLGGTKFDEKSIQIAKNDFLINRALAAAGAWFLRFQGSKLGAKTHQKTIKKTKSTSAGILASIFDGFWWIWGSKLAGKIEPRGIKNGIEKTMKKWRTARWQKNRIKKPWRP